MVEEHPTFPVEGLKNKQYQLWIIKGQKPNNSKYH